jgi:hypothetical protein
MSAHMSKKVLMVAFHFPPIAGSSGVQRTLRFVQHLPRFGWQPLVLSAHPRAYAAKSADLLAELTPGMLVRRAQAFDCARHFALCGRYPGALARPDRFASWRFDGLRQGRMLIREHRPDVIWSTFPIATSHVIGGALARESGLPWVADFRDPMAQEGYPADPRTWALWSAIERDTLSRASRSVFVAPGALRFYRSRYPKLDPKRLTVIENGFDEDSFDIPDETSALDASRLTLLHSGVVYPSERDPKPLFRALQKLRGQPGLPRFSIRLRAPGDAAWLNQLIRQHGIEQLAHTAPPLPYREALLEMQRADALVVMQAKNCNDQIPAKVYEYLRAARPILALADPAGDTAALMRHALGEAAPILDPADEAALTTGLPRFLAALQQHTLPTPEASVVLQASRMARTRQLAELLDTLTHPAEATR